MCNFWSSMTCRKILIYWIFALFGSFWDKNRVFSIFFAVYEIPLRKYLWRKWKTCDFGLKMNWSETSDLEIIRIFSFSLATKWSQGLRVNVKLRARGWMIIFFCSILIKKVDFFFAHAKYPWEFPYREFHKCSIFDCEWLAGKSNFNPFLHFFQSF